MKIRHSAKVINFTLTMPKTEITVLEIDVRFTADSGRHFCDFIKLAAMFSEFPSNRSKCFEFFEPGGIPDRLDQFG